MIDLHLGACRVRPFVPDDAPSLARHANDPEISRHLRDRFPFPYTLRDAHEWVRHCDSSGELSFALEVDGECAGGIGLVRGDDVHRLSAELGYWVGRAHWGRGLATQAVRATSEIAFQKFGLVRLWAQVFETNPASMRVLEKAGFVREAWQRRAVVKAGHVLDAALYAKVA